MKIFKLILNVLKWIWDHPYQTALSICFIIMWANFFNLYDFGKYFLIALFGIPFFYICMRLDQIEQKVQLKVSKLVAIMKEDSSVDIDTHFTNVLNELSRKTRTTEPSRKR